MLCRNIPMSKAAAYPAQYPRTSKLSPPDIAEKISPTRSLYTKRKISSTRPLFDLRACCCLLGAMSLTSSAENKLVQVTSSAKYQEEKGSKHRALWHTILRYIRSNGSRPNCTLNVLFFRNSSNQRLTLGWIPIFPSSSLDDDGTPSRRL